MGFFIARANTADNAEPGLELGQSDSRVHTLNLTVLSTFPNILRMPVHYPHSPLSSTHVPPFATGYKKTHSSWTLKERFRHGRLNKILLGKSAFLKYS